MIDLKRLSALTPIMAAAVSGTGGSLMKLRRINDVKEPLHKTHKSKKKHKRIWAWIRTILVTALLIATAIYTALSPLFNIDRMAVKGNTHYDSRNLIAASGIRNGMNGFRQIFNKPGKFYFLRIGSAERAIMDSCPYIKNVKVRFVIPSSILIEVSERKAAAILSMTGTSLLIDREGYLLELDPNPDKTDLPVIKGIQPDAYKPGLKLNIQENVLESAYMLFDAIEEIDNKNEDKLLPVVDFVDVGDIYNVSFMLQSRVLVNLGKLEDLNYKISAAQTIFYNNIKKDERGRLDFSTDENPVFTPENGG